MGIMSNIKSRLIDWFLGDISSDYQEQIRFITKRRDYRNGLQKRNLKVRPQQADDNLTLNFTSLVSERDVSMLLGKGVKFDYGKNQQALDCVEDVYKYNHSNILFHRAALMATESGMVFIKTIPQDGSRTTRLIALDPILVTVETDQHDWERVTGYIIRYKIVDKDMRDVAIKEETLQNDRGAWEIVTSESRGGRWQETSRVTWEYDFPPILHWQNKPSVDGVWGQPDITDDVIALQDRINFVASNISKIIRMYAHPPRWGRGLGDPKRISLGPDDIIDMGLDANSGIWQLDPVNDTPGASGFLLTLRQALMDITRTVDVTSLADKLGALTNFGLHVLYQDALQKLETKRQLWEEGFNELNRRILQIEGLAPDDCEVIWPEPLPENATEETQALEADLRMQIVSKETVSEKRGYVWEDEKERMDEERAMGESLGAQLLRAFDSTGGNSNLPGSNQNEMSGTRSNIRRAGTKEPV